MILVLSLPIRIFQVNYGLEKTTVNASTWKWFSTILLTLSGSPFKVPVDHTVDVKSVRAYGPGLDPNNVREGITQNFKVDASKAGRAPLVVDIVGKFPDILKHDFKKLGLDYSFTLPITIFYYRCQRES